MLQKYNLYKVLEWFLKNPTKEIGWRALSDEIKLGPPSTKKYINELKKNNMITERKFGARTLFRANRECRKYKFFMAFDMAFKLEECGLIDFLNKAYGYPTIIMFGSFSTGEATEESDVDIAVLTESHREVELKAYIQKLGRDIHFFKFDNNELLSMRKKNKSIVSGISNGFVLSGRM